MKAGIVGAGIMGRLLAYHLVSAGWQVSLFDKDESNSWESCSMAAAGLLLPFSELDKSNKLISDMCAAALNKYWKMLIESLQEPIFFANNGSLVLSHPQDRPELIRFIDFIGSRAGSNDCCKKLSAAELQNLEPELSHFDTSYFFENEGQLDNQSLLFALANFLKKNGVQWYEKTTIQKVLPKKIMTSQKEYLFDVVFDCRGLGAKSHFPELRGLRGELVWLHAPQVRLSRPVKFLHPRYSIYIAPRPNNIYIVGASEIESEQTNPVTVRTLLELLSAAYYLHPAFAEANVIKTLQNCRPTLPDIQPAILFADGFIAINGLYRYGFALAPTLAEEVMSWLKASWKGVVYPQIWKPYDKNLTQ